MSKSLWYACWGPLCAYCHERPHRTDDHVLPRSKGGNGGLWNLLPACYECNCSKGSQDLFQWLSPENLERFTVRLENALKLAELSHTLREYYRVPIRRPKPQKKNLEAETWVYSTKHWEK